MEAVHTGGQREQSAFAKCCENLRFVKTKQENPARKPKMRGFPTDFPRDVGNNTRCLNHLYRDLACVAPTINLRSCFCFDDIDGSLFWQLSINSSTSSSSLYFYTIFLIAGGLFATGSIRLTSIKRKHGYSMGPQTDNASSTSKPSPLITTGVAGLDVTCP